MIAEREHLNCDIRFCKSLCCRNCAVLTQEEFSKLITEVKDEYGFEIDEKYFRRAKGEHGIYFAIKMIKGNCIFLNKEKRCRIYRCRPKLCELYPVIDVNAVDEHCPMINKLPAGKLGILKRRYKDEIDEKIQMEHVFTFI